MVKKLIIMRKFVKKLFRNTRLPIDFLKKILYNYVTWVIVGESVPKTHQNYAKVR